MKINRDSIKDGNIPRHIAIIMDGNGRWAKSRSLPRIEGHRKGSDVIEPIVDNALELGIQAISLFAFSTENWTRPRPEVLGLWKLLEEFFNKKIEKIKSKGIRVKHSGSLKRLPPSTKKTIANAIEDTKNNKNLVLNFCLNYGSRQEIIDGVNTWIEKRKPSEKLTQKKLEKELFTSDLPEVDLLIRTSGEFRISNFMLWQLAYAELVFLDVLWPDFKPLHLYKAIYEFQNRDRRFGGI